MQFYVVASHQQKLVTVDTHRFYPYPIKKENVYKLDLDTVFNASTSNPFIACTSMEDAIQVMKCLIQDPQTWPQYDAKQSSPKNKIYGSPVVFTIDLSEQVLDEPESILCGADLAEFPASLHSSIPLYPFTPGALNPSVTAKKIDEQIATFPEAIKIRKIMIPLSYLPRHALYFDVDGESEVDFDLNTPEPHHSTCTIV